MLQKETPSVQESVQTSRHFGVLFLILTLGRGVLISTGRFIYFSWVFGCLLFCCGRSVLVETLILMGKVGWDQGVGVRPVGELLPSIQKKQLGERGRP